MLGTQTHEQTSGHTGTDRRTRTMRELLNSVCAQYPNANNERLANEWRAACEDEGEEPVGEVWLYALTRLRPVRSTKTAEQKAAEEAAAAEAAERSQREWLKNMLRLDFKMPNGKLLGDCTGPEVQLIGGIWVVIAMKVGNHMTKEVLSNDDLQAMVPEFAA